ncbi:hypothetical protein B7463_g9886, partial [Scytalidium lignicola]
MDTQTPPVIEALEAKSRRHYKISTVFHVVGIAWGAATFGYGGSIIGTTLGQPSFIKYMGLDTAPNADQLLGAMNALFYIGGIIGGFLAGFLSDKYGRKFTVLFGAAITLVATALTAGSVNIAMFIVFRAIVGLGCFIELATAPLWITELVPPKDRGILSDATAIGVNVGYVSASYVGVGFFYYKDAPLSVWRAPLAIGCLPCLIVLLWVPFIPESPRYLLLKDQIDKAWEIVKRLHSTSDDPDHTYARAEFNQMRTQLAIDRGLKSGYIEMFRRPSYRKRVFMGMGLTFALQSSGVLVINNYGTLLYKDLGFNTAQQLLFQAGWLAVSFSLNCAAITIVDRLPRNILMTIGLTGCLASLISEAAIQAKYLGGTNKSALAGGVAMLYSYVFFYAMFLDGCSFWYVGEIFPSHLRANGFALAMAGICLADIIWLGAAPTAFADIGWKYYLFFIIITAITTVTVFFTFPNTLNVPLEEVARLFGDHDEIAVHANQSMKQTISDKHESKDGSIATYEHVDSLKS